MSLRRGGGWDTALQNFYQSHELPNAHIHDRTLPKHFFFFPSLREKWAVVLWAFPWPNSP